MNSGREEAITLPRRSLIDPVSVETVFVEYKQDGYIYGYDWLETVEAQERKQLIKKNPIEFLYFTKPTNKGTIQTAEMLVEARNEEELAAIWIVLPKNCLIIGLEMALDVMQICFMWLHANS